MMSAAQLKHMVSSGQPAAIGAIPGLWRGGDWAQAESRGDTLPTGFASLDAELPGRGWPRSTLVELLLDHPGIGELGLLMPALAGVARTGASCVWVLPYQGESGASTAGARSGRAAGYADFALPYAPALLDCGVDPAQGIFVRPQSARESGWALEQSLRAPHLGALIGWFAEGASPDADFRSLRRLHLLAQKHRALVFIVRSARHAGAPSPASLRLQLQHREGLLQLRVLKRRGRPLLEPVALQIHPARWNGAPQLSPFTPAFAPLEPAAHPARQS